MSSTVSFFQPRVGETLHVIKKAPMGRSSRLELHPGLNLTLAGDQPRNHPAVRAARPGNYRRELRVLCLRTPGGQNVPPLAFGPACLCVKEGQAFTVGEIV